MENAMRGSIAGEFFLRLEARKRWEAANPELAAAWNEALREEEQRELRREAEEARARAEMRVPDALTRMGVPDPAVEALASPRETAPWKAAGSFLEGNLQFLALLGSVGCGKTVAAARVLAWAARKGLEGHFVRATTLARLSGYDDRSQFERLCWAPVVVLDDFGTEHLHGFARSMFHEWLDCRHSKSSSRTVITANLTWDEFAARVEQRAADRIRSSGALCVGKGESMRRKRS